MTDEIKPVMLEIALKEYETLKQEQTQRIGFRDNMLYIALVAIGGVVSYALGSINNYSALLLVPWICIILGWTYLVNDEKISLIGKYLRVKLNDRIRRQLDLSERVLFGWEVEHRTDRRRTQRKVIQFVVDEIAFCFTGIVAVTAFLIIGEPHWSLLLLSIFEIILLLGLGIEFLIVTDFIKGRD
jgi:hypothetical protein